MISVTRRVYLAGCSIKFVANLNESHYHLQAEIVVLCAIGTVMVQKVLSTRGLNRLVQICSQWEAQRLQYRAYNWHYPNDAVASRLNKPFDERSVV